MTYFKLNTILACSVGICMAAAGPSHKAGPNDGWKNREKETRLPGKESPLRREVPEKVPTPPVEEELPARDEPGDSPAGSDDKKDCDECVLVRASSGDADSESTGSVPPASGKRSPFALASTLWGLFCVGRPRPVPKTLINGLTLP